MPPPAALYVQNRENAVAAQTVSAILDRTGNVEIAEVEPPEADIVGDLKAGRGVDAFGPWGRERRSARFVRLRIGVRLIVVKALDREGVALVKNRAARAEIRVRAGQPILRAGFCVGSADTGWGR